MCNDDNVVKGTPSFMSSMSSTWIVICECIRMNFESFVFCLLSNDKSPF